MLSTNVMMGKSKGGGAGRLLAIGGGFTSPNPRFSVVGTLDKQ